MPDLFALTKEGVRKLLGIANKQALGRLDIETNVTTVSDNTERTKLRLWNKDDATNSEYLELRSRGTDGYVIEGAKTGTGSNRNFIVRNGGIDSLYFASTGDCYFTGNFLAVYNNAFIVADPTSTNFYVLQSSNITAQRNILLPLLTENDTFVFEKHIQNLEGKTFKPSAADSGITVPIKPSYTTIANTNDRGGLRIHNVDNATNDEYLEIIAKGTNPYRIQFVKSGSGSYRDIELYNGNILLTRWGDNGAVEYFGGGHYFYGNQLTTVSTDTGSNIIINCPNGINTSRVATFPVLAANDTIVMQAHQQGFSNKTTLDFVEQSDPASPAANHGVVWFDDTDEKLKIKKSDGTVVDLEATGGGGTAREDLVAQWDTPSTKTNIGSTYVDIYDNTQFVNAVAKEVNIDFTDKTQYRMIALWNKVGTGTQQLKACQVATPTNVLHNFSNIASGRADSGLTSLPAWATGVQQVKLMALSATAADDPIFQGARIYLK